MALVNLIITASKKLSRMIAHYDKSHARLLSASSRIEELLPLDGQSFGESSTSRSESKVAAKEFSLDIVAQFDEATAEMGHLV